MKVTKVKKVSNLERIVKHFDSEIPDEYKETFPKYVGELGNAKFDFISTSFSLDDLGENIIKALYLWDPENKEITTNYKIYFMKVEEEAMGKDLILAKIKSTAFEKDSDDGWGDAILNGDS